jgi:hypothetical protein
MPDRMLQNHNCVAALQHRLSYNGIMNFSANHQNDQPAVSTRRATGPSLGARLCRAGLIVVALLGSSVLVAACGGGSHGLSVVSLGKTTTTTGSSAAPSGSAASRETIALAYINCMRTHGEPNMPDPSSTGGSVHVSITPGSGVNPNSPQFTRASNACKHLLPNNGVSPGNSITPADQADYLRATACMRSHGVPDFPDPDFQNGSVTFTIRRPLDPNSPQYKSALARCQKLIPAGLPYSSTSGS